MLKNGGQLRNFGKYSFQTKIQTVFTSLVQSRIICNLSTADKEILSNLSLEFTCFFRKLEKFYCYARFSCYCKLN